MMFPAQFHTRSNPYTARPLQKQNENWSDIPVFGISTSYNEDKVHFMIMMVKMFFVVVFFCSFVFLMIQCCCEVIRTVQWDRKEREIMERDNNSEGEELVN